MNNQLNWRPLEMKGTRYSYLLFLVAALNGANLVAQTNSFPTSGNVGIEANLTVGWPGSDYGVELLPNVGGNSIFWMDDYNNMLRFSNGNTPGGYPMVLTNGGALGVGTGTPDAQLDSAGVSRFELTSGSVISSSLMNAGNLNDVIRINAPYSANPASGSNAGAAWGIRFIGTTSGSDNRNTTTKGPAIFAVSEDSGAGYNRANGLAFYTNAQDTAAGERVRISNIGNVGIGTTSPGAKLEVNGNLKFTSGSGASITFPDGSVQSTAYTGVICGGDYAESMDVSGNRDEFEPGDVLVLDTNDPGKVLKSFEPYSMVVAGVYSTKPGVTGRRQLSSKSATEVPMAMVGVAPTKVSTENGPIKVGDLLVSSSRLGYAMKGTDRSRMFGAVIGKAMDSIDSGAGAIEVLITLQ